MNRKSIDEFSDSSDRIGVNWRLCRPDFCLTKQTPFINNFGPFQSAKYCRYGHQLTIVITIGNRWLGVGF